MPKECKPAGRWDILSVGSVGLRAFMATHGDGVRAWRLELAAGSSSIPKTHALAPNDSLIRDRTLNISQFLGNAGRLLANPRMAKAYSRWAFARLTNADCEFPLPDGGRLGGFATFSEYWSTLLPADEEIRLIRRMATPKAVIADIGANRGMFAVMMARLAPTARIFAFEAAPVTAPLLKANLERNGIQNVEVVPQAVCDRPGTIQFTNRAGNTGQNSIHILNDAIQAADRVDVPATTLDDFCEQRNIERFDFVKIDVEGAEPLVLRGAAKLFARKGVACAMMEVCPAWLELAKTNVKAVVEQVESLGYRIHHLADTGEPGPPATVQTISANHNNNVLLLPN